MFFSFSFGGIGGVEEQVLLVIAHPDDEAMFFSPTLLALRARSIPIHVLCLSTGNYDGLGRLRSQELVASCASLGVPKDCVTVLDDPLLQDGPQEAWPPDRVAAVVKEHAKARALRTVVTFDAMGVSGHPNHRACHAGVSRLLGESSEKQELPKQLRQQQKQQLSAGDEDWAFRCYELVSTTVFRRFLGILELLLTLLGCFVTDALAGALSLSIWHEGNDAAGNNYANAVPGLVVPLLLLASCTLAIDAVLGFRDGGAGAAVWATCVMGLGSAVYAYCAPTIGAVTGGDSQGRRSGKGRSKEKQKEEGGKTEGGSAVPAAAASSSISFRFFAPRHRMCFCSLRPWRCHQAMRAHASQYVWYRRLYVAFSRYVFVNVLLEMRKK